MNPITKEASLHWAELFDSWRVIPRLFFATYFVFWAWITVTLLLWYIHLPSAERTLEASGFGSAIFLTATGFLKQIYETYARTSRDWGAGTSSTSSIQTTTIRKDP